MNGWHTDGGDASLRAHRGGRAPGYIHPAYPAFACATMLLPAHPSFQSIWLDYGIPSYLVAAILSVPVFYYIATHHRVARAHVSIIRLFAAYIFWMVARSISSPAFGQENYFESLRSLVILTPLSLLCAFVAAKDIKIASTAVITFGALAVLHLLFKLVTGDMPLDGSGFVSLSSDDEKQNYQSTSYYCGFAALAISIFWLRSRRMAFLFGLFGLCVIVALMSVVGARSSLVALFVGLLVIIFFVPLNRLVRGAIYLLLLCALVLLLLSFFGSIDIEPLAQRAIAIDRFAILLGGDDSSSRIYLFSAAISMWLDSAVNFLIGAGLGSFPVYIGATDSGWYPHNFILETLAEGGLLAGLLLFRIGALMPLKLCELKTPDIPADFMYFASLAFYAVTAYQFMGGITTLWIPSFFVALFLGILRRTN